MVSPRETNSGPLTRSLMRCTSFATRMWACCCQTLMFLQKNGKNAASWSAASHACFLRWTANFKPRNQSPCPGSIMFTCALPMVCAPLLIAATAAGLFMCNYNAMAAAAAAVALAGSAPTEDDVGPGDLNARAIRYLENMIHRRPNNYRLLKKALKHSSNTDMPVTAAGDYVSSGFLGGGHRPLVATAALCRSPISRRPCPPWSILCRMATCSCSTCLKPWRRCTTTPCGPRKTAHPGVLAGSL